MGVRNSYTTWASRVFIACGVWLFGLGLYFVALRPGLLPEDARFIGSTLGEIRAAIPGLERWLHFVFSVVGGFMAAMGILTLFVSLKVVPTRAKGTGWVMLCSGLLTVMLMSGINFTIGSDFKWLLLAPAVMWAVGLGLYSLGLSRE